MQITEITEDFLYDYLKLDEPDIREKETAKMAFDAAKKYIKNQTGMDDTALSEKEDITVAVLVLTEDFYDNRRYYVDNGNLNKVVEGIIYQYSENLL